MIILKNNPRLVLSFVFLLLVGCMRSDFALEEITVHAPAPQEQIDAYIHGAVLSEEYVKSASLHKLVVGMPVDCVVAVAGPSVVPHM